MHRPAPRFGHRMSCGEPDAQEWARPVLCPANDYVEQAMHRRVFCLPRAKSRLASLNITIARRAMQLAGRMVDSGRSASLRRDGNDRVTSAGNPVHVRGYEVQRHVVPTSPRRRARRRTSDEESASIDPRRPIMLSISQLQMARSRQNLPPRGPLQHNRVLDHTTGYVEFNVTGSEGRGEQTTARKRGTGGSPLTLLPEAESPEDAKARPSERHPRPAPCSAAAS